MKKFYSFLLGAALALSANAQTWKLNDMTDEQFAHGGADPWSFEKYSYETGTFSPFQIFGERSTCNYVDIYQPERVGGQLFQDLDKEMFINGEFTWAVTYRNAWYDTEWEEPSRTDANAKFVYVSRADMLGNIFEVCGNQEFNAVVSFLVPADGYYKADGIVIRQDGGNLRAISLRPRFRIGGTNGQDARSTMGLSFPFGEGGEFIDGVTNFRLADGYEQRYTAQQPAAFTFAFKAKAGDVLSFEVSYADLPASAWPRDYYPRTFYRQLSVEAVSAAVAEASEHYVDPYNTAALDALKDALDSYQDLMLDLEVGNQPGEYPQNAFDAFDLLCSDFYKMIANGTINVGNADIYLQQLEAAWQQLLSTKIYIDADASGNYRLFGYTGSVSGGDLELYSNAEAMASNEDNPWGFYGRVPANGTFERFANHDDNNLAKETAWYRGSNQWYYITDNGTLHPLNDRAPGIMFTALEDGIYRLDLSAYRPNPNPGVENPLYIRWYHLMGDAETAQTSEAVLSREYGSVAGDGQGGKAPIDMTLFANLHAGDRLFFEVDCYTSGRNSSAGTQILNLTACRNLAEGEPLTADIAAASGFLFINPYGAGDCTELRATIAEAHNAIAAATVGTEPGQYTEDAIFALQQVLFEAEQYAELEGDPSLTQSVVDQMNRQLQQAIIVFAAARIPFTLQPTGEYGIRLAGSDKFITRKNRGSGNFYYADLLNLDGIYTEMARVNIEIDQFTWIYTFTPVEGTCDVTITTDNGYMTPDAYIQEYDEYVDEDAPALELPTYTLVRESADATTFAIRRNSDGRYWGDNIEWKSPVNKITTSETPLFIWTLDATTIEQATGISELDDFTISEFHDSTISQNGQIVNREIVKYLDLSGRRVSANSRGILIRRTTYADGRVESIKIIK